MSIESEAAEIASSRRCDYRTVVSKKPEAAVAALAGLAQGKTKVSLASEVGIGREALARMEGEHREWIDGWRRRELAEVAKQAEKARRLGNKKLDRLLADDEALDKVGLKDLAVAQAVYLDKLDRLANLPGVRVEHVVDVPRLEDVAADLDRLRAARGRVLDV